jgi:hypothetical protein
LWNYLQAALAAPINEFTPLIVKVILENSSEQLMKAYGKKFGKKLALWFELFSFYLIFFKQSTP